MKREHIDPEAVGFTQVVTVEKNGIKTVYMSGQTAPGDTLADQSNAVYADIKRRLEASGAAPSDVVKMTTYIVDYTPDKIQGAFAGFPSVFGGLDDKLPAHTVVGVQALYQPEILLEVELIAEVDMD